MIKLEHIQVFGWPAAIRGMRNPMNSWDSSDSYCEIDAAGIGEKDLKLMQNLVKAGNDHSKFLRMINVTMDITAPLYFWKEFDTYKVATVANSCSTMHKIHNRELTLNDFSHEHLIIYTKEGEICRDFLGTLEDLIDEMNVARNLYIETKDKKYWWQIIQLLPSSYNQKRTVQLNYQVLKNMYHARTNHKLDEWHDFCNKIETLPYFKEICIQED